MARVARKGFFEEKVFPVLGYYPWECSVCRCRQLLRKRGERIWSETPPKERELHY